MKAALVTGASGFIGSHASERFAGEGWRVFALLHRSESPRIKNLIETRTVEVVRGDLSDRASVQSILAHCREQTGSPLDAIAHCAGRASDVGWDSEFRRANFDPVRYLGEATVEGFARRFVFVSTTDVYGLLDHHQADEDLTAHRAAPRNPYPLYKIRAEEWLRQNLSPSLWSIVRPAAVWGPDDPTLAPRIIDFLRHSPFIVHFGPWRGKNRWPLAHVDNVAQAIYLAATLDKAAGEAVNVIDSERTTVDEFYRLLSAIHFPGKTFRTLTIPLWTGWALGAAVSAISNALNLRHPLIDPSLYALYSVSRNLDFSNRRWIEWMEAAHRSPTTREEGLRQLQRQSS